MTREHKLALIVGFSLILLVGVLISDHLSRARQAKVAPVSPTEAQVTDSRVIDPMRTDGTTAMPQGMPITVVQNNPQPEPAAAGNQTPPAGLGTPNYPMGDSNPTGTRLASGTRQPIVSGGDPMEEAIRNSGGTIVQVGNHREFVLNPAVAVNPTPDPAVYGRSLVQPPPNGSGTRVTPLPPAQNIPLYTIQKGDTLIKIAERTYGSGKLWHELAKFNNIPESGLKIGAKIKLPSREILTGKPDPRSTSTVARIPPTTPAAPAPGRPIPGVKPAPAKPAEVRYATYTVKSGDTLGHISQKALGSSKRVQEIIDLNKLDDEDAIAVGTVLKMPVRG